MPVSLQGHSRVECDGKGGGDGKIPDAWKDADVTLTPKKGKVEDPGNYTPVSLTPVSGKVMEQILPVGLEAISKRSIFGESSRN